MSSISDFNDFKNNPGVEEEEELASENEEVGSEENEVLSDIESIISDYEEEEEPKEDYENENVMSGGAIENTMF